MDWATRIKIAFGTARALAYLHHGCRPRIVHRDVSSTNILLAENLEPRLSDFGLARLLGNDDTHVSVTIGGTYGYIAPGRSRAQLSLFLLFVQDPAQLVFESYDVAFIEQN